MIRASAIIVFTGIAVIGGTMSWLNLGGEARKEWFWCDLVKWCEPSKPPPKPYACTPQQKEAGECL